MAKKKTESQEMVEVPGDEFNKLVKAAQEKGTTKEESEVAKSYRQTTHQEVTIRQDHFDLMTAASKKKATSKKD